MTINRRQFLSWAGAVPLIGCAPSALSYTMEPTPEHRALKLRNLHTGEKVNVTYFEHGDYLIDGLAEIYLLMRDHRENLIAPIDIRLLDQLHATQQKLDTQKEILLVSAYRSPETNQKLREQGAGVAKHSLHMSGQALDFRIPGLSLRQVHKATLASTFGGVGYYSRAGFVHMDTGRKRRWSL